MIIMRKPHFIICMEIIFNSKKILKSIIFEIVIINTIGERKAHQTLITMSTRRDINNIFINNVFDILFNWQCLFNENFFIIFMDFIVTILFMFL